LENKKDVLRHEYDNVEMKYFGISEKKKPNPFCLEDVETMSFETFSEFPSHSFLFLSFFFPLWLKLIDHPEFTRNFIFHNL